MLSRIKVIAELDIEERRVPQAGRFKVAVQGREIDLRVSVMPNLFGEDAVALRRSVELVAADGELLRVDRLVEGDDALWIIDFKWRVTDAERPQYEAQVRRYAEVMRAIDAGMPVRLGLVTAQGELIEVQG